MSRAIYKHFDWLNEKLWKQIHHFVLHNLKIVDPYEEHMDFLRKKY